MWAITVMCRLWLVTLRLCVVSQITVSQFIVSQFIISQSTTINPWLTAMNTLEMAGITNTVAIVAMTTIKLALI
jgi:hypothetical protein